MIKKNNKGFTLVEVLIAMTILGIVVVPLLQAFVVSARTNAKAKNLLDATMVAENIMEELKASSFNELAGKYQIISEDDGTGHHFSVNQTVDEIEYKAEVNLQEKTSEIADIHSMNEETCAYYAQPSTLDKSAAEEFYRRHLGYGNNAIGQADSEELAALMNRTITIVIEKDDNGNALATLNYTYELPYDYVAATDKVYTVSNTIYDGAMTGEDLKAIYAYFYPINTKGTDTIQIENKQQVPLDLYLIQMEGEGVSKTIHLLENGPAGTAATRICTNMESVQDYTVGQGFSIAQFATLEATKEVVTLYEVEIDVYKEDNFIQTYTGSFREQGR